MKILQVNKFYYPKDGVSNYLLALEGKLRAFGHEVRVFAMASPKNIPSPDEKYFVSQISFNGFNPINIFRSLGRIFYSREAARKFQALINDFRPDLIHVHNIYHQLSPSILAVALKNNIPVVMHLHDYKLICPNYKLFTNGQICKRCQNKNYWHCFLNKCLKNSYLKSLGGTLEMYYHHRFWKIYEKGVKTFIAPSRFMKNICVDFGWPENKIIYLNNFFTPPVDSQINFENRNYLLAFSRLAPEKGIKTLIESLAKNQETLIIAGEGPEEKKLKALVKKLGLSDRVDFVGFQNQAAMEKLIREAKAVVIPSVWYENMPLNLLESLALGKIVVASRIGGIPEIIRDGDNGLLFNPGDSSDLANKIRQINTIDKNRMTLAAKESVAYLNLDSHVSQLLHIYKEALKKN